MVYHHFLLLEVQLCQTRVTLGEKWDKSGKILDTNWIQPLGGWDLLNFINLMVNHQRVMIDSPLSHQELSIIQLIIHNYYSFIFHWITTFHHQVIIDIIH